MLALIQHAYDFSVFNHQFFNHGLPDIKVRLVFDHGLHRQTVELLVALHAGGMHRRTFGGIEQAKMHGGFIGDLAHLAAEGVNFLDQLTFGQSPDGRIAGHQRDGIQIDVEQNRPATHARAGQRRFAAGMSAADNRNIIIVC